MNAIFQKARDCPAPLRPVVTQYSQEEFDQMPAATRLSKLREGPIIVRRKKLPQVGTYAQSWLNLRMVESATSCASHLRSLGIALDTDVEVQSAIQATFFLRAAHSLLLGPPHLPLDRDGHQEAQNSESIWEEPVPEECIFQTKLSVVAEDNPAAVLNCLDLQAGIAPPMDVGCDACVERSTLFDTQPQPSLRV
jgi:hypothetical protein